ncbi:hypothetical protein ABZ642_42155 [Streptomyces sp. NPDC007157]|uniref:hypothetical protein n=1 Tax=Streptomyces sp. NPDC007157 TaxID=3154681 RepID=UPI0033C840A1
MEAEYLRHGMPLVDYQLAKADHRRQHEAVRLHEWVKRQLAMAPPWSEKKREQMLELLGSPPPPWEFQRCRLRLYCGHIVEAARSRKSLRPDGGVCDKETCPECGLDPSVIVAFEPLGPLADPPPERGSQKLDRSAQEPPTGRRSKAELAAENAAMRAELQALRAITHSSSAAGSVDG